MCKEKIPVVFILGSGHCGSTLLDMLLGSHSKVCGVGEVDTLVRRVKKHEQCTCKKKIGQCNFWKPILKKVKTSSGWKVARKKINTLSGRSRFYRVRSQARVPVEEYIKNQEQLYTVVQEESGCKVIVDSSKNAARVALLAKSRIIQPVVIHLIRDGRGVLYSYLKKYKSILPYLWKWVASNIKVELLHRRTNVPYVLVKYGDLANNPKSELKRILSVVGLSFEKEMLSFRNNIQHQIGGNRMRLRSSEEIREDTEWKEALSYSQKVILFALAGWMNWYYMHWL